jgi:hypothetical protein
MSLLGHATSFFGQFSHHTIVVAPSLTFENVFNGVVFMEKNAKKQKQKQKNAVMREIFYLISQQ